MNPRTIFALLKQTFDEWNADKAPRLAASIAYYVAFSLAPLLVFVIAIAGVILSEDTVRTQVIAEIRASIGSQAGELVEGMIESTTRPAEGIISSVLSLAALLFGAIGAFEQMQAALDTIWGVPAPEASSAKSGILRLIKDKLLSFGMLVIIGFLLLVSLVISTVTTAVSTYVLTGFVGAGALLQFLNLVIATLIIAVLFALIYKVLPHTKVPWRDALIGGVVTSVLFTIGRFALGLYLSRSTVTSIYGAAGSFVLILLWIYYSAQIVLFGAEFTQVYSNYRAKRLADATATPKEPRPLEVKSPRAVGRFVQDYIALPSPTRKPVIRAPQREIPKKQPSYLWGLTVFLAGVAASLFRTREANRQKEEEQKS